MCVRIGELRESLVAYAAGFDAARLTVEQTAQVVEQASRIENMAATLKALATARLAEAGTWRTEGDRSAAHHLARHTGVTVSRAAEAIDTARRLAELPETLAAARRGDLSAEQTSAIVAVADAGAESGLLEKARRVPLAELREECARTAASARGDPEARRRRIHQRRALRSYTDTEGEWHLHCRNNPEVGALIMAALVPLQEEIFRQARAEGRQEPPEANAADALTEMARRSQSGEAPEPTAGRSGGTPKIIVRVDLGALLRGRPLEGEVCEIAGFGPVAVSAVRDMIDTDDPFLAAVATRGDKVVGVAHLGRRPNARQQTALQWLYPGCANEGCSAQSRLDYEHRVDWADSRVTVLDLLDRLCRHCHALKTRQNWSLVDGRGKRPLVPPHDPRHPRNAAPADPKVNSPP